MNLDPVALYAALEQRAASLLSGLAVSYANEEFTPVQGQAYASVAMSLATPRNDEFGGHFQERGVFDVLLKYPLAEGWGPALAMARAVRAGFPYGDAIPCTDGSVATVSETPSIPPAYPDNGRWVQPVRIAFHVNA